MGYVQLRDPFGGEGNLPNPVDSSGETTFEDYGRAALATTGDIVSSLAAGARAINEYRGDDLLARSNKLMQEDATAFAEEQRKAMSPAAQNVKFTETPFRYIALKGAEMSPYVVAAALPGGIVGNVLGVGAGTAATFATGAALNAGAFINEVDKGIDAAGDEDLQKQSDYYAGLRSRMDEKEARLEFKDYLLNGDGRLALEGIVGGLTNIVGPGGMTSRIISGAKPGIVAAERGILGRTIEGGAIGGGATGIQAGVQNYDVQSAQIAGGFQKEFNSDEWTAQTLEAMGLGAAFGGGAHALFGKGPKSETKPTKTNTDARSVETVDVKGPDQAQAAALKANDPSVTSEGNVGEQAPPPPPTAAAQAAIDTSARRSAEPSVTEPKPVQDQGQTVPESKAQFEAQVADLADPENPRIAVLFPKGTKAKDRPALPEGMEQTSTKDGVFYYDPTKTDRRKIFAASKEGRLNDVLSMADTTKADVAQAVQNGAEPTAVVVRDQTGTPKVEAASSSDTVARDVEQIAARAAPTDTVEVTRPENVIAERQQSRAAEAAAALDQARVDQEARTQEPPTVQGSVLDLVPRVEATKGEAAKEVGRKREGRVLENLTQDKSELEEIARLQAERDALIAEQNKPAGPKETEARPNRIAKRNSNNEIADNVVNRHAPSAEEDNIASPNKVVAASARKSLINRVRELVAAAEKDGFSMPKRIKGQIDTRAEHNAAAVLLREAKDLIKSAKNPSNEQIAAFFVREKQLRAGFKDEVVAERKAEGEQKAKPKQNVEEDVVAGKVAKADLTSETMNPEEALIAREEIGNESDVESEAPQYKNEQEAYQAGRERKSISGEPIEKAVTAGKDKSGTFTTDKRPKFVGGRPALAGKIILTRRAMARGVSKLKSIIEGKPKKMSPDESQIVERQTLSTALRHADMSEFEGHEFGIARDLVSRIMNRIEEAVGKVEVITVDQAALDAMMPDDPAGVTRGLYDPNNNKIYISHLEVRDGQINAHTLAHEGVHALVQHVLEVDPTFHGIIEKMAEDVRRLAPDEDHYGLSIDKNTGKVDVHEFIAEALSNPDFQSLLSSISVSPRLRQALELDARTGTMWDALVRGVQKYVLAIREALGFGSRDFNMLSAVMRVAEQLDARGAEVRALHGMADTSMPRRALIGNKGRELLSKVSDRRTDIGGMLRTAQRATDTMAMIARRAMALGEKFGGQARIVDELTQRMDRMRSKLLEREGGGHEIVREGDQLSRKYGDKFNDLLDVMFRASELNVNLGKRGETADNAHLGKDSTKGWQGKGQQGALERKFQALPEELQDWALKTVKFGRDERNAQSLDLIKTLLKAAGIEEKGLAERIHQDGVTDADKAKFKTEKIVDHLDRVADLKKMQGWYVPFMREGDFVVAGKRSIGDIPKGNHVRQIDENTVQFTDPKGNGDKGARRAAESYAASHELPVIDVKKVWVDKNDPTKTLAAENSNAVPAYRVRVQNEHFELHKSESDAKSRAAELENDGYIGVYTDILRQNPNGRWGGIMPSQYETVIRSLTSKDSFKGLSQAQQNSVIQAMHEANVRLLPGMRVQKTNLQRKNVAGYSRDLINSMARYAEMSAGYRARLEFQPKIDDALKEMAEYIDTFRDDKSIQRREILREMETRVHSVGQAEPDGALATVSRRLRQLSMLDKLGGVSFHVINSMEPWMTSLPYIGGRHGFFDAMRTIKGAYNLIGARGGVISGLKDTVRAFREDTGLTNYLDAFKAEIDKNATGDRAARLKNALDYLDATNLFGNEAGMEMNRIAKPGGNVFARGLDRADFMARQVGQAIEAINRATTGLAAYELEFKRTGDHAKALEYARDAVDITMGNYAASNASPMFNHPVGAFALQFKKFAQKTYYLLGKTMGEALRGNREAQKQFAGIMFTHMVAAGALGLPLEPIKGALMVSNVLGLTDFTYQDFEENAREVATKVFGKAGGEALMRGAPRLIGVDVSSRMSLADLITFGSPQSAKSEDLKTWLFDTMAGAPAGLIFQQIEAAQSLAAGDVRAAAEKAIPLKAARDINQAITRSLAPQTNKFGKETVSNYSAGEAALRAIGFKPAREAETQEMRRAVGSNTYAYTQKRAELIRNWVNADPKNRAKQMIAIDKFNRGLPANAQVSRADLYKAERSVKTAERQGTNVSGLRFTKRTEQFKDEMNVYNTR